MKKIKGVTSIKRNGNTFWYARIDGQRKPCGEGEEGRKLAEAARHKHEGELYEKRGLAIGMKVKKVEFKNIRKLANWYMDLPTVQEKNGYDRKTYAIPHLLDFFGNKPLNAAEGDSQSHYRKWREEQGAMSGTIDFEIAVLSAMYHEARKDKKISADTVPGQFVIKNIKNPRRLITDEEYGKLLEYADKDFADVLICGYESGMRNNEICTLTVGQVHLNVVQDIPKSIVDYIDLGIFDTKNKTKRTVPVSARLKEVLERRLKGLDSEDRVFKDSKGHYTQVRICYKLKQICQKANIIYGDKVLNQKGERTGIVFHCLRHTRLTKWFEAGYSDILIRRASGHLDVKAYQQYIKLGPSSVMRLVQEPKTSKNGNESHLSLTG